jgi:hypothetical protein
VVAGRFAAGELQVELPFNDAVAPGQFGAGPQQFFPGVGELHAQGGGALPHPRHVLAEKKELAADAADDFKETVGETQPPVLDAEQLLGFIEEAAVEEYLAGHGPSSALAPATGQDSPDQVDVSMILQGDGRVRTKV